MGGLFAAVLLAREGHDVMIYERSVRGLGGRGAGLLGRPELFALLREIGCDHVSKVGIVARESVTLDRSGGVVSRDGKPAMEISWDYLHEHLLRRMPEDAYRLGAEVVSVRQEGERAHLTLASGAEDWADLVIGADGVGSAVRRVIAGDNSSSLYAGYVAWRGLFPERNLDLAVTGPIVDFLAFFPMAGSHAIGFVVTGPRGETEIGSRRYNWVWYRPASGEEGRSRILTDAAGVVHPYSLPPGYVSDAAREALIADASELLPPALAGAVGAEPRPFVQAIFDYEAPALYSGRVALLGDAAFTVRPHTGRGAAKAAGDALALRNALRTSPVEEALRAYHAERHPVGLSVAATGRQLGARLLGR